MLKPGDIILVHSGKSLIARGIAMAMRIYARKIGVYPPYDFHHAGTILNVWGKLCVGESAGRGYQVKFVADAYTQHEWEEHIVVMTPVKPYTKEEQDAISMYASNLSYKITRYEYINFVWWIAKIITGDWFGKTGTKAEKRMYCSESAAMCANHVRPGTFTEAWETSPLDVYLNNNYR
jgi:hypothetical protein